MKKRNSRITKEGSRRHRNKFTRLLACMIVFITVYALILPAVTMNRDTAVAEDGIVLGTDTAEQTAERTDASSTPEAVPADAQQTDAQAESAAADAQAVSGQMIADGVVIAAEETAESSQAGVSDPQQTAETAVPGAASAEVSQSGASETVNTNADVAAVDAQAYASGTAAGGILSDDKTLDMPAMCFTLSVDDITTEDPDDKITITAEAEENTFPAGTTMTVETVTDQRKLTSIKDAAEKAVSDASAKKAAEALAAGDTKTAAEESARKVADFRALDITFRNAQGEEIEPAQPVRITFTSSSIAADDRKSAIVHVDDAGKGEVVQPTDEALLAVQPEDDQIVVDTDAFSVYVIVGTETMTVDYLTADGKTLRVTLTFDESAQIPAGAVLEVKEYREGDEGWGDRSARLASALSEEYGNYFISDARFLSISIMVDGKEFEPKAPVSISVEYTDPMQTEYTVDSVNTDPYGIGEFAGVEEEPQMITRFAVVHYTDDNTPEILNAEIEKSDDIITESVTMASSFSDYDFVNFDEYEVQKAETDNSAEVIRTLKAGDVAFATENEKDAPVLRSAGGVPNHSKSLQDNNDGTYTIGLNVEGDADTTSEASDVNVLIVYDVSSSMTIYHAPSETGRYGAPTSAYSTSYTTLYYRQSSGSYAQLTNDNYSGTVYTRSGGRYNEYHGKRYSALYRADVAEKTVYDFVHALFGYQNAAGDNINAAVVTFDASAHSLPRNNLPVTWTQTESDITQYFRSSGTTHNSALYGSGTNWEAALGAAETAVSAIDDNGNPTYVVFITDGAPTNRNNSTNRDVELCYEAARDEARRIYTATTATDGEFFGIYAYGEEADWLASLMYYANNNAEPPASIRGTTFDTAGYYNAASTTALTNAINEIFQKIVQTLGVTEVSIADGTTSNVTTSTGIAHMLDVDTSSFQYWLSIPVTAGSGGTYTFTMPDKTTGDPIAYTVAQDGDNVTISWTDASNNAKSVSYAGNINLNKLTIEWLPGESGKTDFYNYGAPAATFNSSTGSVDWNLHPVGTLLDGVTYTVTFDCYPSQDTLDTIADLKNGDISYSSLDPAIQQYLSEDYQLKTNTTATLSYTDTRTDNGPQTSDFTNPDPQPVNATEEIAVSKIWNNSLDGREGWKQDLELFVTRDGVEVHAIELDREHNWTNTAWISYGILTEDEDGSNISIKTTGHDYSFSEDVETGYNWEIKAPVVRPMLINNVVTLLKHVDEAPAAITGASEENAKVVTDDGTYYKLTIDGRTEYYIVVDDISAALTATNHRRSYLDVVKTVSGTNVAADDAFTFTMTVDNANDDTADPEDVNSDSWVWFSIWDTINNVQVTDPDAATAAGMRWQLNDDPDNGTVVTTKPAAAEFNGYFCVPSETAITVYMKNGYSLRFLNLPEETAYTITESETMPSDQYSFVSIEGTRSYDADMDPETTGDWTTESAGTVTGQSITGTIEYVESAYKVTVTNKVNTIDVQLKKIDENGEILDGSTFTLTTGGTTVGTFSPDSTDETVGNPVDLGGLGVGIYKLAETVAPDYYETADDVYFQVYKDTDGSLKARLVDSTGAVLSDQSAISSTPTADGAIYTITVQDTRKTAAVKVTKNVVGPESDQSKEFAFSISGVEASAVTANLVGDTTSDDHYHSVTYADIPYGTSVTVTETADGSFTTTYSVNGAEAADGTSVTFTVDDTTVNSEGVAEVVFTNTRSKQLVKVFKYETGTTPEKGLEGALFSLTGPDGTEISYTGLVSNEDGYVENDGSVYFELPVNTANYTLTETQAPDGYLPITEDVAFTVSSTGVSATGSGYSVTSAEEMIDGAAVTVYTIKVQNSSGVVLPNTGGPGTGILVWAGCMLILTAGALLLVSVKRRKIRV